MGGASSYDPETYWDARARTHGDDPLRAACLDDADENRCIDRVQRHLLRHVFRRLQRRTPLHGKTVLDFGCGSGRWVPFLRSYGLVYSGADISSEMLAVAQRRRPGLQARQIRDATLPYADRSFDVVLAVAVLHHNPSDAQERMVAELARVLRSDGALVLFEGVGTRHASTPNYFPQSLDDWLALLGRHGLACTWHRGASYMLLRPLASRAAGWMPPTVLQRWQALLTRVDAIADPYLLWLLPRRYHTRVVMLCERAAE